MRFSGSPGSWPPSAAEFRCVSLTLRSHPKTSNLFPEFSGMLMAANWTATRRPEDGSALPRRGLGPVPTPFPPGLLQPPRGPADPRQDPPLPPGRLDLPADRHPPIAPAAFRKLDAAAVLTGPSLPVPLSGRRRQRGRQASQIRSARAPGRSSPASTKWARETIQTVSPWYRCERLLTGPAWQHWPSGLAARAGLQGVRKGVVIRTESEPVQSRQHDLLSGTWAHGSYKCPQSAGLHGLDQDMEHLARLRQACGVYRRNESCVEGLGPLGDALQGLPPAWCQFQQR